MVHFGKHIIDPGTGLCEICDRGAIHDHRQNKRPGRQFLYSNQDGKFTYRPNDTENYHPNEQTTPRYVRKPLYPEPPSPSKIRPTVYEEPIVKKKVARRTYSPIEDMHHSPQPRLTTLYYVNNTGQMYAQNEGPPDEPRRRYVVQSHHQSPPARPTRVIQRRAQTPPPPPPPNDVWRTRSKRQNNSDTEIIQRNSYQIKPNDSYYEQSPRKVEMYYLEKGRNNDRFTTISSHVQSNYENNIPPTITKNPYQNDTYRKQRQLEPIEQKHKYIEPEQTFVRKVYKKMPTNRSEYYDNNRIPNENYERPVRKVEKFYPSPRIYDSSPSFTHKPSIYHIQ